MALMFQLEGALQLDNHVWKVCMSPSEARMLDPRAEGVGDITVLLLSEEPMFDSSRLVLAFNPSKARLLNAGTSERAVVISGVSSGAHSGRDEAKPTSSLGSGDQLFLANLPDRLKALGAALLMEIRKKYPGDLTYYRASGKYVEAPDNFWTVRPQPRDESFRVTVRGRPESFDQAPTLLLKPDMTGYSSFKVTCLEQLDEVMNILNQVRRK